MTSEMCDGMDVPAPHAAVAPGTLKYGADPLNPGSRFRGYDQKWRMAATMAAVRSVGLFVEPMTAAPTVRTWP
ncbi:MAG: hypothetical protein AAF919_12055 [Pseudomonadota bacterium]